MTVVHVKDGEVSTHDSVAITRKLTGGELRDGYLHDIQDLTLGLVRARGRSLCLGPLELLRFGPATVTASPVEWPIDGGLTALEPVGTFRLEDDGARLPPSFPRYTPHHPLPLI